MEQCQENIFSIPVEENITKAEFREKYEDTGKPVILRGMIEKWDARHNLSPEYLSEKYGSQNFPVSANLPTKGSPFHQKWGSFIEEPPFSQFLEDMMDAEHPRYLHRVYTHFFDGIDKSYNFDDLTRTGRGKDWCFLWVGSANTRSGLHFDIENNLLAQIYGRKKVVMVPPEDTKYVYPFVDNIFKSEIDPEEMEEQYPDFRKARKYTGVMEPGDVLYIPQPWWHNLTSLEPSISISYVYGNETPISYMFKVVWAGGPLCWIRTLVDFVKFGVFKGSFERRVFSDPPTGKYLYVLLANAFMRRWRKTSN